MRTPDNRYSVNEEFCGHETPRYIARFCGEWLRDSALWPNRAGNQCPAFERRGDAIAACHDYERERQAILREGKRVQARAEFYEANA